MQAWAELGQQARDRVQQRRDEELGKVDLRPTSAAVSHRRFRLGSHGGQTGGKQNSKTADKQTNKQTNGTFGPVGHSTQP
jgi:hypothetical protein